MQSTLESSVARTQMDEFSVNGKVYIKETHYVSNADPHELKV